MATNDYTPIIGTVVHLSGNRGPLQPCSRCGNRTAYVYKGISTHPGRASCTNCGKHISWLGASTMDALLAAHKAQAKGAKHG